MVRRLGEQTDRAARWDFQRACPGAECNTSNESLHVGGHRLVKPDRLTTA